jgi:Domain of Unknown Function (DUF1206)
MSRIADRPVSHHARRVGNDFVRTPAFEVISRAGFIARGAVYAIVGVLAIQVAASDDGRVVDQQGALREVADKPFGNALLVLMACGLGGYSLWRLVRAALGHGPEGTDKGIERFGALGSGILYGLLCAFAIGILTGSSRSSSGNESRTTETVFDWPAGRWLVGIAGLVTVGVAIYQAIRGLTRSFLDDVKTGAMSRPTKTFLTWIGTAGHLARAVVFTLIGVFLVKAALEFDSRDAVGLDGALAKLAASTQGPILLGIVAIGLILFAVFSISEARYRKI